MVGDFAAVQPVLGTRITRRFGDSAMLGACSTGTGAGSQSEQGTRPVAAALNKAKPRSNTASRAQTRST